MKADSHSISVGMSQLFLSMRMAELLKVSGGRQSILGLGPSGHFARGLIWQSPSLAFNHLVTILCWVYNSTPVTYLH